MGSIFHMYTVYNVSREVLVAILVEVVDGGVGVAVGVVEGAGEVDEATSMDHSKHFKN